MQIEIGGPACLPLALVGNPDGTAAVLGVSLRYPALNLTARAGAYLDVTGARADHVSAGARRYLRARQLPEQAQVEIELAIPSHMGLGSDALMTLAGAQAVAWVHGQPFQDVPALAEAAGLGPEHALEVQAFAQGGVLLVETPRADGAAPRVLRRQPLEHPQERAWAFVLYLPRVASGSSDTLEADRRAGLLQARPHLSPATGPLVDSVLWPSLAADDIEAFGHALAAIQDDNARALAQAASAVPLSEAEQDLLGLCQAHGAVAWGRSPTGLALFALIRGASPSVALRKKFVERVGIHAGTALAGIVDNTGARHAIQAAPPIYTGASPLVSGGHG